MLPPCRQCDAENANWFEQPSRNAMTVWTLTGAHGCSIPMIKCGCCDALYHASSEDVRQGLGLVSLTPEQPRVVLDENLVNFFTGSGAFVSPLPPLPVPPLPKSRAHHAQLHAPSGWRGTRSINGAARATAGAECSAPAAVWRAHAAGSLALALTTAEPLA
mmetsp:Transcript_23183/g.59586  ORF Transcript_23183/g.59586 Transcript_23183/m.59586 type:complete len:161 (+) Transcript_23183:1361-1843(+)